jgi:hypothetical protein
MSRSPGREYSGRAKRSRTRPIVPGLPPPGTRRWTARRKAALLAAVEAGLLSMEETCSSYSLTIEEFLSWQLRIEQHGLVGLQTRKIKQHRLRLRARRPP